ncbi:hypothetical protein BH23ACT12_BH23ACT12_07430 [soil metagenome]
MRLSKRWLRPASLGLALGMAAAGLVAAFAVKYQCVANSWGDGYQYTRLCYNEIQALFGVRGIQAGLLPYRDTAFEYPVLTGMFMDLAGRVLRGLVAVGLAPANNDRSYLVVSSVMLAPFSLAVTMLLRARVSASRLALWAVGVPTILYTFHNWDILAVFGAAWGLVAFERDRLGLAGGALAVGATAKLYPAFLAPGMVLARWARKDGQGSVRIVVGFLAVYAALNVPWIVIANGPPQVSPGGFPGVDLRDPQTNGWLAVWLFHADRGPDIWTIWYWLGDRADGLFLNPWWGGSYRGFVSLTSFGLFALATAFALVRGWMRRNEPQGYPVVAAGLAIVLAFLITSKVYSPQYALWAVPMLVMLDIRVRWVLSYFVTEFAVLVTGFGWFTAFDEPSPGWRALLEVAVVARAAVLGVLFLKATRAVRLLPEEPERTRIGAAAARPAGV